ncbi:aryl-alcohol dehydrogenase [Kwoniella heveanensis CBS 569]|nr:aryl-alcohol dehydrogenase [Kwoniella heveanensis CBS 569]
MSGQTKMQYVRLGKSGLKVSKLILYCWECEADQKRFEYATAHSIRWQEWVLPEKEGIEHIKFAYEQGINTFDTANVYSAGASEEVLGKALKVIGAPRESVVILTKVYMPVTHGDSHVQAPAEDKLDQSGYVNQHGLSRKHIFDSVQASLKRLQTDYIDVLQCHRFDYDTPIEETMQALHDVVQKGWVRYIGMSSCWAYQFHAMQNYAINNRLTPFISMQNFHNAVYREEEREMIPTLKLFGVGCIPWSPLGRGFLTRPWNAEGTVRAGSDRQWANRGFANPDEAKKAINERVQQLAEKRGVSMAQVALAWSLSKEFVTAPIIGSTSLDKLKDLLAGLEIKLTEEEIGFIDQAYAPQAVAGHK